MTTKRQYNALFRIYKRGETDTRPYTRSVVIHAVSRKEAYTMARDMAASPAFCPPSDTVRITYREVRPLRVRKAAVLVTFVPRTRIVVEIPEGADLGSCLDNDDFLAETARKAREKMLSYPEDYLSGENMEVEEDREIPYGSGDECPMAGHLVRDYVANSDVVIAEYLASKRVPAGTSYEEAFKIYVECMKRANGDRFFVMKEGNMEEI